MWCIEITNLSTSKPVWRSLVAQAICNRQVVGSNPSTGSTRTDASLASVESSIGHGNCAVSHSDATSGDIGGDPSTHQCRHHSLNARDWRHPSALYKNLDAATRSTGSGRDGALAR